MLTDNSNRYILSTTTHPDTATLFQQAGYNRKKAILSKTAFGFDSTNRINIEDKYSEEVHMHIFEKYLDFSSQSCFVTISLKSNPNHFKTVGFSDLLAETKDLYERSDKEAQQKAIESAHRSGPIAKDTKRVKIREVLAIIESLGCSVSFTLNRLSPSDEILNFWESRKSPTKPVDEPLIPIASTDPTVDKRIEDFFSK